MKGWAIFMKRQDDQAIEWLRLAEGGDVFTDLILAAALALNGQTGDAHETLKRYLAVNGITTTTTTIAQLRKQQLSLAENRRGWRTRLSEGLRAARQLVVDVADRADLEACAPPPSIAP